MQALINRKREKTTSNVTRRSILSYIDLFSIVSLLLAFDRRIGIVFCVYSCFQRFVIVSALHSNYYIYRIGHNSPSSGTETEFKSKRRSQISTSSSSVPADGSTHGSTPTPPPLPERTDSLNNRSEEAELRKAPWFQAGIPRYLIHTLDNTRNIILEIFPGNYGFIKIIDVRTRQ